MGHTVWPYSVSDSVQAGVLVASCRSPRSVITQESTQCDHALIFGNNSKRKPYAAVFYSMGLLEFSKALKTYNKKYEALKISPDEVMNEAKLYFDLLRAWMENPTLIGGPKAEVGISKLGDVMCVTGLACEFYEIETDQSKRAKDGFI